MDLESAAKYWWIQEFSNNTDAFITTSTYLYKDRDGKLYWGPLWDFDKSMTSKYFESANPFNNHPMEWLDHIRENDTILKASFVKDEDATGPDEIFFLPYDQYLSSNWRGGVGYLLSPGDVQDKRIYFETSDPEIAEIVPNEAEEFLYEIMPKKTGKVTVTGTTKSGLSKSYTLYVYDPAEHPQEELTEIIPLQDQLSLIVGEHGHPFNNTLTG